MCILHLVHVRMAFILLVCIILWVSMFYVASKAPEVYGLKK